MQEEIEKAVQAGKLTSAAGKALEALPVGAYCLHKSWGFGRIAEINFLLNEVVIDFKTKQAHSMQPQYAAESLMPLAESHILVQKVTQTEAIKTMAREDPAALVRMVLSSYGGRATQTQIAEALAGEIFNEAEFKRWWDGAKKALKKDGLIALPSKKSEPIVLRQKAISHTDELLAAFQSARQTKALIGALDRILKNIDEFKDASSVLAGVLATVEDATQKTRRLNTSQAVGLDSHVRRIERGGRNPKRGGCRAAFQCDSGGRAPDARNSRRCARRQAAPHRRRLL